MRYVAWNRRFWVGAATVVVLLATISMTRGSTSLVTRLDGWANEGLWPVEASATAVTRAGHGVVATLADMWTLRQQNIALRHEVATLQSQVAQDGEMKQEYSRLVGLLKLKRGVLAADGPSIAAAVIGRNAESWFQQVVLGKGSADGVRVGMVVMASRGLVGHVVATGSHASTAMLITNPDSGVGAMIESSREAGVVLGQLGRTTLTMEFFAPSPAVKAGDVVVTSGLGGLYPKGLQIGTVTHLNSHTFGLVTAEVAPSVNLNRLENVLLIPGPPAAS